MEGVKFFYRIEARKYLLGENRKRIKSSIKTARRKTLFSISEEQK